MKNLFKVFILLLVLSSCSDDNLKIEGKIDGIKKGKVYLLKDVGGDYVNVDSSEVNNSKSFVLKTNIDSPELLLIKTSVKGAPLIQVFAEKGEMKFNSKIENLFEAEFEGSQNQEYLIEFNNMQKQFNIKGNELYASAINLLKDDAKANLDSVNLALERNEAKRKMYTINYALTHSNYDIAPFLAMTYLTGEHFTVLDTINKSLVDDVAKGKYGQELNKYLTNLKSTSVGKKFPALSSNDVDGNKIDISNPNGYFLVNIYSSNVENKNKIDQALNQLASKGVKIYSVSIDLDENTWKNSLNESNNAFVNLNDFKGIKGEILEKLAIATIPYNILVDKNGNIAARNADENQIVELINENK